MSSLINPREFLTKFREALTLDLIACNQAQEFYRSSILKNFDKKFLLYEDESRSRREAIKLFLEVNGRMHSLNSSYESLQSVTWHSNPILNRARKIVHSILDVPRGTLMDEMFSRCKNSAGTSLGVKFIDTSVEAKMKWPMTGSNSCERLWEHYRDWDYDLYTQSCNLNEANTIRYETVSASTSRAATVPKSNRIDRFISVEPTLNMFFQQGVSSLMTELLEKVGLSVIRDQEEHRNLAFSGSISGEVATIDFSSMSDSLSLAICHFLLPKEWYSLLFTIRSHRTSIDGAVVDLGMMSTMGNATTFPLETLILYSLAKATQLTMIPDRKHRTGFLDIIRVYGDDCIVPSKIADQFVKVCSIVGFSVNSEKTFLNGPFRESCGGDFYRGRDVRPFYLKSLPRSKRPRDLEAYLYSTINGVIRMYIKYFGPLTYCYGRKLLSYLFSCLRSCTKLVKFVPESFPEDAGICSLRDLHRISRSYKLSVSPVSISDHGMLSFKYLKYTYPHKGSIHEGLRYAILLKSGIHREEAPLYMRPVRKGGFYVERVSRFSEQGIQLPSTLERAYVAQLTARGRSA